VLHVSPSPEYGHADSLAPAAKQDRAEFAMNRHIIDIISRGCRQG